MSVGVCINNEGSTQVKALKMLIGLKSLLYFDVGVVKVESFYYSTLIFKCNYSFHGRSIDQSDGS